MFKWLKKNKKTSGLFEDYEQNIPIQHSKVDLDIMFEDTKHYYEKNTKRLKDFVKMADYFREWLIESKVFKEEDIKISYEFCHTSIDNPKVELAINYPENNKTFIMMGYDEKYKLNIRILADMVYKKICESRNETQKTLQKLKGDLDGKVNKNENNM